MHPTAACETEVLKIRRFYPAFVGAFLALDSHGNVGAACTGWTFSYAMRSSLNDTVVIVEVEPFPFS
jgi:hypothetical protein